MAPTLTAKSWSQRRMTTAAILNDSSTESNLVFSPSAPGQPLRHSKMASITKASDRSKSAAMNLEALASLRSVPASSATSMRQEAQEPGRLNCRKPFAIAIASNGSMRTTRRSVKPHLLEELGLRAQKCLGIGAGPWYTRLNPQSTSDGKSGSSISPMLFAFATPSPTSDHVPSRGSNHCAR